MLFFPAEDVGFREQVIRVLFRLVRNIEQHAGAEEILSREFFQRPPVLFKMVGSVQMRSQVFRQANRFGKHAVFLDRGDRFELEWLVVVSRPELVFGIEGVRQIDGPGLAVDQILDGQRGGLFEFRLVGPGNSSLGKKTRADQDQPRYQKQRQEETPHELSSRKIEFAGGSAISENPLTNQPRDDVSPPPIIGISKRYRQNQKTKCKMRDRRFPTFCISFLEYVPDQ